MFSREIKKSLLEVLKQLRIEITAEEIIVEHPADTNKGDYSTSVALVAAKRLGKPAKDLAGKIEKAWKKVGWPVFVDEIDVAGPGFINIWLKFDALGNCLSQVLENKDRFGSLEIGEGKTVVVDYSSPNIAKPFGIGHLRSTNIGQTLYNLYQFLGYKTIGDSHLGDWGTQFGKLIYQIKEKEKNEGLIVENLTIADLERLYVKFHQQAENNKDMEEKAREWFKKLEDNDFEAKRIWQICIDISLKEFARVYDLLEIKIDHAYGESFYQDKMKPILKEAKQKGLLKESQQALVIEIPEEKLPAMLVKSDGATTYLLRDLATIKYREQNWQPDLYIYEVGVDQALHFKQVFAVAKMLGYGTASHFVHVPHGLIRWSTGKFSTRKGDTIHLEEVLNEAIQKARELCETAGVAKDLSEEEKEITAKAIGIGAIKYNDLKQNPKTDIIFDWEQILSLSGNSGPYLQYTFARTSSVLNKAGFSSEQVKTESTNIDPETLSDEEKGLLRTLYRFSEVIIEASEEYSPNILCNYLFDLAKKFNGFYDKQRIINDNNENFRLVLTKAVGQVLKNGLNLLGIKAPEKM